MVADYKDALVPMNLVIAKELEILGSHGMQAHQYPDAGDDSVRQTGATERLIGGTVTLEESLSALTSMTDFALTGVYVIDRF